MDSLGQCAAQRFLVLLAQAQDDVSPDQWPCHLSCIENVSCVRLHAFRVAVNTFSHSRVDGAHSTQTVTGSASHEGNQNGHQFYQAFWSLVAVLAPLACSWTTACGFVYDINFGVPGNLQDLYEVADGLINISV
jgi:hypothetical protein